MIVNYADAEIDGNWVPAEATTIVQAGGFTTLNKRSGVGIIEPVDGEADNTWVVRLESHDSTTQEFTDVIDVLPYDDDGRGSSFDGTFVLSGPVDVSSMPAGTTVWYSTADPASIVEDPADGSNGAAEDPTGSAIWSEDFDAAATAVRVVGPPLPPGGVYEFTIPVTVFDAEPGDRWVNRAHARAENTALVMRTSAAFEVLAEYDDVPPQLADSGWDGAAATWALLASAGLISAGAWLTAASRSRAAIRR